MVSENEKLTHFSDITDFSRKFELEECLLLRSLGIEMKMATENLIGTILAQLLYWIRVETRDRQGNCTDDKECHFGFYVKRYEEIALSSEISLQI